MSLKRVLPRVRAASPFVVHVLDHDAARAKTWAKNRWFEAQWLPGAMAKAVAAATRKARSDDDFMAALRVMRNEQMARIALRDLAGWAAIDETLAALSELADACCEAAVGRAEAQLHARHGIPRDESGAQVRPFILGMGKLGGRELNFSSDVDLILGFTGTGETDGKAGIANDQYFEKLAQHVTRYLGQRTAEGFVFRVDWLLRPFGASGPPAMTSAAMEEYYQSHGREWERYAFIKARCVAGDRVAGDALLKALRPFVYRRYLDYNAIGALREMKRLIAADVERRELHDNVKLGAGGIREIEFIVQAFQLMRGGQEAALRDNRLRPVLAYLGKAGHLPPETCAALDADYVFLRRLENAIQMQRDEQGHDVPDDAEARAAIAAALDVGSEGALMARLADVRARVSSEFRKLFGAPDEPARDSGGAAAAALLWAPDGDARAARAAVENLGFRQDAQGVVEQLRELRASRQARALSEATLQRMETLVAQLLEEVARAKDPEVVLRRVLDVLAAITGRATYLALLRESPAARAQLVRLCAASPWIADFIAQTPVLLDALIDERSLYAPPERVEMQAELAERFADVAHGDVEGAMNALRLFRKETMLRVAASDLVKALPLVKVSDRLTWLAEVILQKTLELNWAQLVEEAGVPKRADGRPVAFAVVAYGKFGGVEMGYGSDLDIVFLHDCDALQGETKGGKKSLVNEVWLARLAQRIIHWLSTQTHAGRVYEVDLELRPDGRRGLTVNALPAFAQYQQHSAWTWEHQALTRARPVAGDARLSQEFTALRRAVLTRPRDFAKLKRDVVEMRAKMRQHLDKSGDGRFDLKHGRGGLTDIEFMTQYLVLRHAREHPALVDWSDNWRQADALVAAGVLKADQARALIDSYREFRAWLHARDLQQAGELPDDSLFKEQRAAVRALWDEILGERA
ncbi:MAG TPA: bifunctional [glutamate--ammonia ligase]-adenylyl-L-tyrosine phosphorylase/[glutamate--ammonia-ligase] adenylyltransferase [Verrucomicrobiae bacterium]|nr:bifunctional [glutamate--ammonia ligase]-adenylyl-L-tyrosine phosphorylase/[glutamate--ammonia-ligase] adenylyltransferase [Verrucomicrobiae bacterium]